LSEARARDRERPSALEGARLSGGLALERKGEEVAILDLTQFEIGADYFVLVSGRTETHVRALADWITESIESRLGMRPWHVEGRTHGRWVLLDYVDWVVHVFHRETREYYMLDRLWGDAPVERLADRAGVEAVPLPGGGENAEHGEDSFVEFAERDEPESGEDRG